MTTVAYKDGVMASDSLLTLGSQRMGSVQKVWKFDSGALYGARGDGDDRALRELLEDVTDESRMPRASDLEAITAEIDALFVLPDGIVFHISTAGAAQALRVGAPYHAIGSGYKYALGAMADGSSAARAVLAASKHDGHTGGDVQSKFLFGAEEPMSDWYWAGKQMTKEQARCILWEDVVAGRATKIGWTYSENNKSLVEIPEPLYRHPGDAAEELRVTC